jgi:predicted DsbA family dithiol-disulfide isomerase
VKLIHKNFPLSSHKFALKAAKAALAADKQEKFSEFNEKLFQNQKNLNDAMVQKIATELGLDMARFDKDKNDPVIQMLIRRDTDEARRAGIRGVPAVFINGKLLRSRSLQAFEQMIDLELKKTR